MDRNSNKKGKDPLTSVFEDSLAGERSPQSVRNHFNRGPNKTRPAMIVPLPQNEEGSIHDMIDKQEADNIEMLLAVMGDASLDPEIARRVLRKHGGDVTKAANAFFEGDRGGDAHQIGPPQRPDTPPPRLVSTRPGNNSPIDLTSNSEDEGAELEKAIKASLEGQNQTENALVPSQRAPDPNWAVVPSNVETTSGGDVGMSHDDQTLSRAIEASLKSGYNDFASEEYEPLPIEKQVREGGRPIALRPTLPTLAYTALILQGLFFVPQVRARIAEWRPSAPPDVTEIAPPESGPEHILWSLLEIFVNMDLAQLSELNIDGSLTAFGAVPWSSPVEQVGNLSNAFLMQVAAVSEILLQEQFFNDGHEGPKPRLFHFLHGQTLDYATMNARETSVVSVDSRPLLPALAPLLSESDTPTEESGETDLISRLSAQLARPSGSASQDVILEPSEVVAFQLFRHGDGKGERPFKYGKTIYLDQFLHENAEFAERKRKEQREMGSEVHQLIAKRKTITHFDNKDVLKDLRSSIYYYEHVADSKEDLERQTTIDKTREKLQKILEKIENELKAIDEKITKLKSDSAVLLDCPELQKHRYDLRVVFVHDGLFGRKHLHSYVQDKGRWWKTADSSVEEVSEETVLTDQAGLHLGAGPYLVIYSRALPDEENEPKLPWPEDVKNTVKHNNRTFLSQLPPEIAQKVVDVGSPPTSPFPMDEPLPGEEVSSEDAVMDVTS